jgi:hypothetical protein
MSAETQIPEVGDSVIYIDNGDGWFKNGERVELVEIDENPFISMKYLLKGSKYNHDLWVNREEFYIVD